MTLPPSSGVRARAFCVKGFKNCMLLISRYVNAHLDPYYFAYPSQPLVYHCFSRDLSGEGLNSYAIYENINFQKISQDL
jgi:hypothetical protein